MIKFIKKLFTTPVQYVLISLSVLNIFRFIDLINQIEYYKKNMFRYKKCLKNIYKNSHVPNDISYDTFRLIRDVLVEGK
jgi:hypothetical protein